MIGQEGLQFTGSRWPRLHTDPCATPLRESSFIPSFFFLFRSISRLYRPPRHSYSEKIFSLSSPFFFTWNNPIPFFSPDDTFPTMSLGLFYYYIREKYRATRRDWLVRLFGKKNCEGTFEQFFVSLRYARLIVSFIG